MKRPTSWNFKAVFAGWAIGFFSAIIVGLPLFILLSGFLSARGVPEQLIDRFWHEPPMLLALISLGILSDIVGGFATAHLARRDEIQHASAAGLISIVIFIAFSIFIPEPESPLWYNLLSFAVILPSSILGGYLRSRRPRREGPAISTHPPIPEP